MEREKFKIEIIEHLPFNSVGELKIFTKKGLCSIVSKHYNGAKVSFNYINKTFIINGRRFTFQQIMSSIFGIVNEDGYIWWYNYNPRSCCTCQKIKGKSSDYIIIVERTINTTREL